ncbi:fibroblast growth factor-binding protein 1 [Anabas testudineus]|uniref:Fibroblast growth factor binding protein 1b n=1 Tax=Anabas testudineus TaxID=64144 RepID=A0A7N6BIB5_ANATE|nr:fibroblast growth factor-binding protein 1 [Anabas testudineus]
MLLLRTFAPWLLLVFLGPQVSLSSGDRSKKRGTDQTGIRRSATGGGKFSIKGKMQCTWRRRDVGDTVTLSVKCETPETRTSSLTCEYVARPQSCPGYLSDDRGFWKQVARALNRLQAKVCTDDRALVKAGMCKRAPRDAHFKLRTVSSAETGDRGTPPAPPVPPARSTPAATTACTGRADHGKTAEEYCGSSWASACALFLSMLQRDC